MKKIYSLIMVSAIVLTTHAQLVFDENFPGYTNGNLGTQGSWVQNGTGTDVQIASTTPLVYSGYTSGSQYATVSATDGTDPHKLFNSQINTNTDVSIFMSFVVRVSSATASNSNPAYSLALLNSGEAKLPLRFYVATEPGDPSQAQFGILTGNSTNPNNVVYTPASASFATGTTHLIVIRYDISSAPGNNDDAYLWVDPNLNVEPTSGDANASVINANEANFGNLLNALKIFQTSANSPSAAYDGFRIAYGTSSAMAWANLIPAGAPLPVRLTSFNASEEGLSTKLIWNTVEEDGITSYIIEKSTDGRTFNAVGSVKAANQRTYSFTDVQPVSGHSYYRLKMVETDGTYKLSYIISVNSKLTTNISLSPNPVKNMLMIQHPKVGANGHIQIINANGQMIRDIKLSANAVISNIDLSNLASGMYHVVFRSGSDMFSRPLIKQ